MFVHSICALHDISLAKIVIKTIHVHVLVDHYVTLHVEDMSDNTSS